MIILSISLIIYTFLIRRSATLHTEEKNPSICFLIPARDESKVIENLLKSILNQTISINSKDIYVIVEDSKDDTVSICKKYGISVVVRKNLKLRTKGYAIDEALKNIHKKYDLYFIIDADNILDKNFAKEMLKSYKEGYDIVTGYRNIKNGNDSLVAAASGLIFSLLNNTLNKNRSKNNIPVILSGTGFCIKGNVINKFDGYPFNSLTEDYELSLYSILNNLNTTYNNKAIFYDEQPIKFKNTINQRRRWIKGYFVNRKKYIPLFKNKNDSAKLELIGIKPYIMLVIGIIFWIVYFILKHKCLISILILIMIYFILSIITFLALKHDININMSTKMKMNMLWYFPIFLASYIFIAVSVLVNPNVEWKKVEHNRNIKNIKKV